MGIPFNAPLADARENASTSSAASRRRAARRRGRGFSRSTTSQLEFKPAQPELPIVLGVKGPRALGLAGEIADGVRVLDHVLPRPRTPGARDRAARRRRPRPLPVARLRARRDRRMTAARRARPRAAAPRALSRRISTASRSWPTPGLGAERTLPFREARAPRRAGARHLVTDAHVDALAVAGSPDHCAAAARGLGRGGPGRADRGPARRRGRPGRADRALRDRAACRAWKALRVAELRA